MNSSSAESQVTVANYCVCFMDLLGQRKAMEGQGLLPDHATQAQEQELIGILKSTVGKIVGIQRLAQSMVTSMQAERDPPGPLVDANRAIWSDLHRERTITQRWSDGLMVFSCLADNDRSAPINGIFSQFCLAGAMCLLGLAGKAPLRGGIDIAWGAELNPGELYGPAVANAYILESERARFPRIVVGDNVLEYLTAVSKLSLDDVPSKANHEFASVCLRMISRDSDGVLFLDYLAAEFERVVSAPAIEGLWAKARAFIDDQLALHSREADPKLLQRYVELASYFDERPPPLVRN